ncbi:MAG: hypothetical protein ACYDHZ_00925 [Dehalococcoidia bacterium]
MCLRGNSKVGGKLTVRAKFQVIRLESSMMQRLKDPKKGWSTDNAEIVEVRSIVMTVVGSNSPENEKFWATTPSGEIKLGVVNPEVWPQFPLGKEVYADFEPVETAEKRIVQALS